MKKIMYVFLLSIVWIMNVNAFEVDVDKIEINGKGNNLIERLDKSYKIETDNFNNEIIYDENIQDYAKELLSIAFSDKSNEDKNKELIANMYFSKENGFDTISGSLFIQDFVEDIDSLDIKINYIKDIKTTLFNETDRMVFIYLPNSLIEDKKQDLVVAFWLKCNEGEDYKLFFPWFTIDEELDNYFADVTNRENQGINIGGSFKKIGNTSNEDISSLELEQLYENNKYSSVQITGMNSTGSNTYGSGFFIREGVIVTTWSLFLQLLTDSNYMFVNDVYGNTYEIEGVIAAEASYDVVVLKLYQETGQRVVFGNSTDVKTDDILFTINSKSNSAFVINYGTNLAVNNGRMENMFLLSQEDVGSALYNRNGEVVGFNVADQLYSELSYANSTDYLKELQTMLVNNSYDNIASTSLEIFKENYYLDINEEKVYNEVDNLIWTKFSKVGNIDENITLKLLKASYVDDVLSLRYQNDTMGMMNSIYLVSNYTETLSEQGYRLSYNSDDKVIYTNGEYKVIIKNSLNYLVIIIMEV